jgi:hypothetical protein
MIEPEVNPAIWWTTHVALVPNEATIPAGIHGHYFTINASAEFRHVPFVAEFEGADDCVVLAYKVVDKRVYMVGATVDKIINFKPPKGRADEVPEASILSSYKLPHDGMKGTRELANTETHKLLELTDTFISYLPTFKAAKLTSVRELNEVQLRTVPFHSKFPEVFR